MTSFDQKRQHVTNQYNVAQSILGEKRKADRIRTAFAALLQAAMEAAATADDMRFTYEGESEDSRRERINGIIQQIISAFGKILVELHLEDGMDEIILVAEEISKAFRAYVLGMNTNKSHPGSIPWRELRAEQHRMDERIADLRTAMRGYLVKIEAD